MHQKKAQWHGLTAWRLPVGAPNLDQVYEFIKYPFKPELAGEAIDHHGYNSPVLGADKFAGEAYALNFADAYPGEALNNLNPWPSEPQWYADTRTEYANRFESA